MEWIDEVDATIRRARRSQALAPIGSDVERVADGGVDFILRVARSLELKQAAAEGSNDDPFLPPYDERLFLEDLSETHACLLNKFPVLDRHLLIVTKSFEDQREPLNRRDFEALWSCMRRMDGLGFYNGGRVAGASQDHKHLQLVGYPLTEGGEGTPVDAVIDAGELPFSHRLAAGPAGSSSPPVDVLLDGYHRLLDEAGITPSAPLSPYNLLVTRRWMMLVPRKREEWAGISVNSLGYAGSFFARNEEERERILREGPMSILRRLAGGPRSSVD